MKKRSVVYSWILELALMLGLMAAMCLSLTFTARSRLLAEYTELTAAQQEKTEAALENSFAQLRLRSVDLISDVNVKSFSLLKTPYGPDNYSLVLIQSRLNSMSHVDLAGDTLIYFKSIEKALSCSTIYEKQDCVAWLYGSDTPATQAAFDQLVYGTSLNRLVVLPTDAEPRVLMLTSIPTVGRTSKAVVLQQADVSALRRVLQAQPALQGATTVLMTQDGQMVCSSGDSALAGQLAAQYPELDGDRLQTENGAYWLRQKQLASTGWTLITAAPMSVVEQRSDWVWQVGAVYLGVFGLLGLVVAAWIVQRNYQPLKQLTSGLPVRQAPQANEYDQIGQAPRTVQSDLEDMKLMQQNQRISLRREWLENTMAYDTAADRSANSVVLDLMGFSEQEEYYRLVMPRLDDAAGALDFLHELEPGRVTLLLPMGCTVLYLSAPGQQELETLSDQVYRLLEENGITWLNSPVCQGFAGLHAEFLNLTEQAQALLAADAGKTAAGAMRLQVHQADEAAHLAFSGRGDEACAALDHALSGEQQPQGGSPYVVQMGLANFLLHLMNTTPEGEECAKTQQAIISTYRAIQRVNSYAEMRELTDTLLLAIAEKYQPAAAPPQPDLLAQITQCVQQHFREHDFNVSRMADLLGVSVSYLSKYFKEHTGINLLGYLNGVRIDYAKQLITEERLTVAAAADRAGFENINTFIRLFKKYVGDTPGNYSKK